MSRKTHPHPRVHATFTCNCRRNLTLQKGVAVTFSTTRLRAVLPKAPVCIVCGSPMKRNGATFQALLDPNWDGETDRARVESMFGLVFG